jgi:adenylate cyclase
MTITQESELTIFFADIVGSVQLYDSMGNARAHALILSCLNQMTATIGHYGGRVVEVIGDEVMAVFSTADSAFVAACEIQRRLMQNDNENRLGVRIGFHCGLTAVSNNHPYGDTVNIAARMVNLAKSGQILVNQQTLACLSKLNKNQVRFLNSVFLKGKRDPYMIYEVLWEVCEQTMIATAQVESHSNRRCTEYSLCLYYRGRKILINEASGELLIGRGQQCSLNVNTDTASRIHTTVNCHNGKIVLKDQSTNGTFIRTLPGNRSTDGLELFIHREEWVSDSSGIFSLGKPIRDGAADLVQFQIS